jgi:carbon storage regulator
MLVLRRKAGEAIVLNQVIMIRVLGVEGDRVKLGIDAPPDVIVVREELLEESTQGAHNTVQGHGTANHNNFEE